MSDTGHPAHDGLEEVKKGLSQKVGPLPVGVWIAAIAGGLLIAYFIRKRSAAGDAADPETNTDTAPGIGGGYPGAGSDGTQNRPANNQEWLNRAVEILVGKGYNPLIVISALGHYLDGDPLTTQEQAIVSAAIRELGPPPEYVKPADPGQPPPDDGGDEGGDEGGDTPIPTPTIPGQDPPSHSWPNWDDPTSWSNDWSLEPPDGWDGGGHRQPAGDYYTPEGVHGYQTPVNANPGKTAGYWLHNDGQHLKEATPYGADGRFTLTKSDLGAKGNPHPDGPPGYVPGQTR